MFITRNFQLSFWSSFTVGTVKLAAATPRVLIYRTRLFFCLVIMGIMFVIHYTTTSLLFIRCRRRQIRWTKKVPGQTGGFTDAIISNHLTLALGRTGTVIRRKCLWLGKSFGCASVLYVRRRETPRDAIILDRLSFGQSILTFVWLLPLLL